MQKVDPMVVQIGNLINKRFETFSIVVKAEIHSVVKASEERVTKSLRTEIQASEDRATNKLRGEIQASEDRVTGNLSKKLEVLEKKIDGKVNDQEKRFQRLEEHAGFVTPIR